MNYVTHNDKDISIAGTCLQGYIDTTYKQLVKTFGKALKGEDRKVRKEWWIETEDGTIATIYDWKTRRPLRFFIDWSIGGKSPKAVEVVREILEGNKKPIQANPG